MSIFSFSPFLRRVLLADAVISGATGLLMFAGAAPLASLLQLPEDLLRYAGLFLIPYAGVVAWIASPRKVSGAAAVWAVIITNAIWATDSIVLLLSGWVAPNILGYTFVIAQAAVVGVLAELQFIGIKKTAPVVS